MSRILLVTGMAGAGRTTALKVLEDIGYEAVDNLPAALISALIRPNDRPDRRIAIGIDCRSRAFDPHAITRILSQPGRDELILLFLDCESEVLRRRFTETRRRHPLASERPIMDGIAR
ncbi:MAG: RNase adapter RapZ, partial [Geminicoccaceae bacterium]|nr:RNase adapter RapZ [Geminicoccaceae bacterium]